MTLNRQISGLAKFIQDPPNQHCSNRLLSSGHGTADDGDWASEASAVSKLNAISPASGGFILVSGNAFHALLCIPRLVLSTPVAQSTRVFAF